jgi:hormone-sensitive lipase
VPVFSVDYRLAPGNPYPDPINDCFQAYVWIMTQAKDLLNMDIKHVILAGDSAGGHLALSTTLLAMVRGFRLPDALLVHYPVWCIDINRFFPSSLLALDEELLS